MILKEYSKSSDKSIILWYGYNLKIVIDKKILKRNAGSYFNNFDRTEIHLNKITGIHNTDIVNYFDLITKSKNLTIMDPDELEVLLYLTNRFINYNLGSQLWEQIIQV